MKNFNWAVSIAKYVLVYSASCKIVHAQVCKIVFKRVDKKSYLEKVKWGQNHRQEGVRRWSQEPYSSELVQFSDM